MRERRLGRLTDTVREAMLQMRAEGFTISDIAIAAGFHPNSVQQVMRDAREEGDERAAYRPAGARPKPAPIPDPESPAAVAGPGGGAPDDRQGCAAAPNSDVSAFGRMVASLHLRHGLSVEEARHQAGLQLARSKSPTPSVAADRAGITRYQNSKPFRLGDPARLLQADHSRGVRHAAQHEDQTT